MKSLLEPNSEVSRPIGKNRREAGSTWLELLVLIFLLGFLIALALPSIRIGGGKGQMTQTLSNMKQLYLATQQMALDGEKNGDKNLGWPGDTGGTFTNWAKQLVPVYVETNEFCKLLSAPGVKVPLGRLPTSMSKSAVLVYAISSNSLPETIFLTTANYTNGPDGGTLLGEKAKPYGNKGLIVFRRGGDGAILQKKDAIYFRGDYVPPLQ